MEEELPVHTPPSVTALKAEHRSLELVIFCSIGLVSFAGVDR